jgi:hypothetical protein
MKKAAADTKIVAMPGLVTVPQRSRDQKTIWFTEISLDSSGLGVEITFIPIQREGTGDDGYQRPTQVDLLLYLS